MSGQANADNVAIGHMAGKLLGASCSYNTIVGSYALDLADGGESHNVAIGYNSMTSCDEGGADTIDNNIAIGTSALTGGAATITNTIAIGYQAADGTGAIDSTDNIFIGSQAGGGSWTSATSTQNVGIGTNVLDAAMNNANGNVAIGHNSMSACTSGAYNTGVGRDTLKAVLAGASNTAMGNACLQTVSSGSDNAGFGVAALLNVATKSGNTAIGRGAGRYGGATGTSDVGDAVENSTFIGYKTRSLDTTGYDNETVIGSNACGGGANTVTLGARGIRYLSTQITMSDFTSVNTDDAATAPLLKIPQYGFLKRVTCTVVTASVGTGQYNIALGTAIEAPGDAIAGRVEIIGAGAADGDGTTSRTQEQDSASDTNVDIILAKRVHIWEANQSTDACDGWMAADMYLYVGHANGSNGNESTNATLRITAEYWGED